MNVKDITLDLSLDIDRDKVQSFCQRVKKNTIKATGYTYNFSQTEIDEQLIFKFQERVNYYQLVFRLRQIIEGSHLRSDADFMHLHHCLRNNSVHPKILNFALFYHGEKINSYNFAEKVHKGEIKSFTDRKFDTFVYISLAGSIIFSRLIYDFLNVCCKKTDEHYKTCFIDCTQKSINLKLLSQLDLNSTLFILDKCCNDENRKNVEKIFDSIIRVFHNKFSLRDDKCCKKNFVLLDYADKAKDIGGFAASFFIDSNIQDRFSACSVRSILPSLLVFGKEIIEDLLNGAKTMDNECLNGNILENPCMLASLYSFFENREKEKNIAIFLPFAKSLSYLPASLQYLLMGGNCRNVNMQGDVVEKDTEQLCFGVDGEYAHKAILNALCRGTHLFSLEMIGFRDEQELLQDMEFASLALFFGRKREHFYGKRCNTFLIFDKQTPFSLGQIIAYYENRTIFHSFLYDVDCFDQRDDRQLFSAESIDDSIREILNSF